MTFPRRVTVGPVVVAQCGCIWRESRPYGFTIDPDHPRVCSKHRHEQTPYSMFPSPQGMAMVRVLYLDEWPDRDGD